MSDQIRDIQELEKMYGKPDPRYEPHKLPFIKEVCDLLDVMVLTDIESYDATNENETRVVPVLALGCRAEYAAGMIGFTMTPWFRSAEELNTFCEKHIVRFRVAAETFALDLDVTVPDATDWEIV